MKEITISNKHYTVHDNLHLTVKSGTDERTLKMLDGGTGKLTVAAIKALKSAGLDPKNYYGYGPYAIPAEVGALIVEQKIENEQARAATPEGKADALENAWLQSEIEAARQFAALHNEGRLLGGYNPHVASIREKYFVSGPYSVFAETRGRGDRTPACKAD